MASRNSKQEARGIRLDAYLARAGLASRKQARAMIRGGRVVVGGAVCRDAAMRVGEAPVELDGEGVDSPLAIRDFLVHKPEGLACSRDEREAPLVYELLDETTRRRDLLIAGRLDRATSGLLVLTTDGDLVHRLTHPARKLPKRYRIEYTGTLEADAIARCEQGLLLAGESEPLRPAALRLEGPGRAMLTLREGRTHQVRRMIRALGGEVVGLHRDRVGNLDLPADLAPGDWRPLAREERALLLSESSL